MLKLKDYPQTNRFSESLQLHNADFLRMLPLPHVMHPEGGPLNLAVHMMAELSTPSDLGPKSYIACGRCVWMSRMYGAISVLLYGAVVTDC